LGVIERLAVSWEDASFAVVAVLAWLFASYVSCPQASVRFVSKAGIEITAVMPLLGPIMDPVEDDDSKFQEDDLELCCPPGLRLLWSPSLPLSQIMPPHGVYLSALTSAQHPLRC